MLLAGGAGLLQPGASAETKSGGPQPRETRPGSAAYDVDEEAKKIKAIGDWATEIVWLDELYDFTERFPNIEAVRLTEWTGDPLTTAKSAKGPARTAKVRSPGPRPLKGVAINTTDPERTPNELVDQLARDRLHYKVGPPAVGRNTSSTDSRRFPQQFQAHVEVAPRPPSEYTLHLNAKAPEPEQPAEAAGDPAFGFGVGNMGANR